MAQLTRSRDRHDGIWSAGFCLLLLQLLVATAPAQDKLQYPLSIAADDEGRIYVADRNLPGIWRFEDEELSIYFQAAKEFRTPLNAVRCVEVDREGRLLVGDSATRDVYRFDSEGQPQPLTRQGETFGQIGIPMDIAVDSEGTIYVSDLETQRVVKLAAEGGDPVEVAAISACRGLAVDQDDRLWVVSTSSDQLFRLSSDGKPETIVAGQPFQFPHTVVVDDTGTALVCDGYAKTIWKIESGQEPQAWATSDELVNPVGLGRRNGRLLVADPRARAVFEVSDDGQFNKLNF